MALLFNLLYVPAPCKQNNASGTYYPIFKGSCSFDHADKTGLTHIRQGCHLTSVCSLGVSAAPLTGDQVSGGLRKGEENEKAGEEDKESGISGI